MKLDYGTSLSPFPVLFAGGSIKKPSLREIAEITFDQFSLYELFLSLTPESYHTQIGDAEKKKYWNSLSKEQKEKMSLYDLILEDDSLQQVYTEIFNFFYIEKIVFVEDAFVILKHDIGSIDPTDIAPEDAKGIIFWENFDETINIIQQICCINSDDAEEEDISQINFKNEKARKLYIRMKDAEKKQKLLTKKKNSEYYTIPNIISKVSSKHPSINLINVWDLTIFQLFDKFNCLQVNCMYDISWTRCSVWGDKEKAFDASLWFKNKQK